MIVKYQNNNGHNNVFIGYSAGMNTTGNFNTFLGSGSFGKSVQQISKEKRELREKKLERIWYERN